jgi:hypothetical protein
MNADERRLPIRVYPRLSASLPLSALSVFAVLALAACGPRATGTPLPVPRVITEIAPTTTQVLAAASPEPRSTATEQLRLPLVASVILRVRSGPGTSYDTVGLMQQGETAAAIGRTEAGDWLLIEMPVVPGGLGWVSREFTAVEGEIEALPVSAELIAAPTLPPLAEFDLPPEATSTPLPPGAPTLTATPVVTAPPAEIGFYADTLEVDYTAPCTYLRWIAKPAQAVYLDGESMLGRDFIAVCPRIPSQTYTLEVITLDAKRVTLTLTITNSGIP